jgi:hypothetical protein
MSAEFLRGLAGEFLVRFFGVDFGDARQRMPQHGPGGINPKLRANRSGGQMPQLVWGDVWHTRLFARPFDGPPVGGRGVTLAWRPFPFRGPLGSVSLHVAFKSGRLAFR